MSDKSQGKLVKQKLLSITRYLYDSKLAADNSDDTAWYESGLATLSAELGSVEIVRY